MGKRDSDQKRDLEDFAGIASDWFWETDAKHRFTYFSARMQEVTRIPPELILGKRRDMFAKGFADARMWQAHLEDLDAHRPFKNLEYKLQRHDDGSDIWLRVSGKPRFDADGGFIGYRGTGHDITDERLTIARLKENRDALAKRNQQLDEAHAALQQIADKDALTNLLNRRTFARDLDVALRAPGRDVALLHIDLDRFKWINDTLGHPAGDAVLVAAAGRIAKAVCSSGQTYRVGGDEYQVLLDLPCDDPQIGWIADAIITGMAEPIKLDGQMVTIGASIGIATGQGGQISPDQIVAQADVALYEAKKAGRNRFSRITPELQAAMQTRRALATDLRDAIATDAFVPFFQPQVHIGTGAVVGAEALVRWRHPQLGLLAPAAFLDTAADMGLIAAIDRMMLRKALQVVVDLKAQGMVLPSVAVNISAARLADPQLPEDIRQMWTDQSCQLCVELVETLYFDDVVDNPQIMQNLKALRSLGVRIEIDDFGSARASLTGLLQIRPQRLKIDRKLVQAAANDPLQRSIVAAIFEMTNSLGIEAMAEGVETEDDIAVLRKMGCNVFQGFAFAPPLDADAFAAFFTERRQSAACQTAK